MKQDMINFLLHGDSWYDACYYPQQGHRYPTFKAALNLLLQRTRSNEDFIIVETGCQRMEDDWGAGMSTGIFAEFCITYGGQLYSVDIDNKNVQLAKGVIGTELLNSGVARVDCDDSVNWLRTAGEKYEIDWIDLLYLDSWDYPYFEILDLHGGRDNPEAYEKIKELGHLKIREQHADLIRDCQEHTVKEFEAAESMLNDDSILLIDDSSLTGGGKAWRLHEILSEREDWELILDFQQSLWIKRN